MHKLNNKNKLEVFCMYEWTKIPLKIISFNASQLEGLGRVHGQIDRQR